jgi:hypothetical protein
MIRLTREDWCEIYYALELKSRAVKQGAFGAEEAPGQDGKWAAHLETIMRKIGPDGGKAAIQGVGPSD